MPDKADVDFLK